MWEMLSRSCEEEEEEEGGEGARRVWEGSVSARNCLYSDGEVLDWEADTLNCRVETETGMETYDKQKKRKVTVMKIQTRQTETA